MTIFLDLDGTIINSFERHYLLLKFLLEKNNLNSNFNEQEYMQLKKDGFNNYKFLTQKLMINPSDAKNIQEEWIKNIEDIKWLNYDKLYDDSLEFLNNINNNKIIFLTARSNGKNILKELEKLNIMNYATKIYVVDPKDAHINKSNIIKEYKEKNQDEKIIMIGDTEVDYIAATTNNIKSLILNRGFRTKDFLSNQKIESYDSLEKVRNYIS